MSPDRVAKDMWIMLKEEYIVTNNGEELKGPAIVLVHSFQPGILSIQHGRKFYEVDGKEFLSIIRIMNEE